MVSETSNQPAADPTAVLAAATTAARAQFDTIGPAGVDRLLAAAHTAHVRAVLAQPRDGGGGAGGAEPADGWAYFRGHGDERRWKVAPGGAVFYRDSLAAPWARVPDVVRRHLRDAAHAVPCTAADAADADEAPPEPEPVASPVPAGDWPQSWAFAGVGVWTFDGPDARGRFWLPGPDETTDAGYTLSEVQAMPTAYRCRGPRDRTPLGDGAEKGAPSTPAVDPKYVGRWNRSADMERIGTREEVPSHRCHWLVSEEGLISFQDRRSGAVEKWSNFDARKFIDDGTWVRCSSRGGPPSEDDAPPAPAVDGPGPVAGEPFTLADLAGWTTARCETEWHARHGLQMEPFGSPHALRAALSKHATDYRAGGQTVKPVAPAPPVPDPTPAGGGGAREPTVGERVAAEAIKALPGCLVLVGDKIIDVAYRTGGDAEGRAAADIRAAVAALVDKAIADATAADKAELARLREELAGAERRAGEAVKAERDSIEVDIERLREKWYDRVGPVSAQDAAYRIRKAIRARGAAGEVARD